jgi:oligopeptide/dipeptide ABC transporter ATP-binding protein
VALIGESGCGKTTLSSSILRVLPPAARIVAGRLIFSGEDLLDQPVDYMCKKIRGKEIGMILHDPMSSLDPVFTIGNQVAEPLHFHQNLRGTGLLERTKELLRWVRISAPESRLKQYPHQLSGGMRQRVVGAISLAAVPKLLIADEPTTNLDVTIQAQYLSLLREIQERTGLAILFVTHNLGIVAKLCTYVVVMYAGKIVEIGPSTELSARLIHPYTRALFSAALPQHPRDKGGDVLVMGEIPSPLNPPTGCSFHPRCRDAKPACSELEPSLTEVARGHYVACHFDRAAP